MTDRYEESQLWLQEPRLVLTDRDVRISSPHPWQLYHSCLGHYCIAAACRTEDTLVYCHIGCWWPLAVPPGLSLTGCLGVGARVWCIRVLPSTQPSQSALARPGPLTLHTEQTSWVSPVTEDREDTDIRHMNTGQWKERGIPREYLPTFCISVFY